MSAAHSRIHIGWQGLIIMAVLVTLGGCSTPIPRVYQPNPPDPSARLLPFRIAVVELEDGSSGEGFTYPDFTGEALIPGYIFGTKTLGFHQTLFGKCVASELKSSQMFATVEYYKNWEKLVDDFKSYDLIVTGHLLHDRLEARLFFYGLSLPGDLFWFMGLPVMSLSREASFDIVAFNTLQPDKSLWSHPVRFEDRSWFGAFYGHCCSNDQWSLYHRAEGGKITNTDLCPTEFLQPQFLMMRKSLAAALTEKVPSHGALSSPRALPEKRGGS